MRAALIGTFLLGIGCDSSGIGTSVADLTPPADFAVSPLSFDDLLAAPSCTDGMLNQDETDIDCGGSVCKPCPDLKMCSANSDCQQQRCASGTCVSCVDGMKDGDETDVDCGGTVCGGCQSGLGCHKTTDCLSKGCATGHCVTPLTASFGMPSVIPGGASGLTDLAVGDFDGDKALDLASIDRAHGNAVVVFGLGNGHFKAPVMVSVGGAGSFLVAGDLNEDGFDDLAVANDSAQFTVLLADGMGGFAAPSTVAVSSRNSDLALGDFDGDRHLDVASGFSGQSVSVVLGTGHGSFKKEVLTPIKDTTYRLAAGDLDGDGKSDVVNMGGSQIQVLLGAPVAALKPTFGASLCVMGICIGEAGMAVADLNQDGKPDVVYFLTDQMGHVWQNDGKGTLHAGQVFASCQFAQHAATADFNHDGVPDVAMACDINKLVSVRLGDGMGGVGAALPDINLGNDLEGIATGDFNRDGKIDIAVAQSGAGQFGIVLNTSN